MSRFNITPRERVCIAGQIFSEMLAVTKLKNDKPNWELQHRIFCVKNNNKCYAYDKISEQFHTLFEMDILAPSNKVIHDSMTGLLILKWFGIVINLTRKSPDRLSHSGRPRARTHEILDMIRDSADISVR